MLRKVMLYLMVAVLVLRLPAFVYALITSPSRFPSSVYVITGGILLYGLVLIALQLLRNPLTRKQLAIFFIISSLASIINMIIVKLLTRIEVIPFDLLVIGTLVDVLFAATFTVMTIQERRYVLTHRR